jgi:Bacterial PH domain
MEYKASLDQTSKIITAFITVLFAGIATWNFWLMFTDSDSITHVSINLISIILILGIYSFCYLFRPMRYIVEKNGLTIHRPLKDYHLELHKIKSVYLTDTKTMKWTIRTFGVGGLFGYYGKFRNKTFGNMTWYATQRNNFVVIETTDNKKIVITPDNPDLVNELDRLIKKLT